MKCIHCLEDKEGVTRDHVFPKSWYPDNTPNKVQRPTAPACKECNGELGQIEDELFQKLAVCIDPKIASVSGIKEKVYRSFGVGVDKSDISERDHSARIKRLENLLKVTRPLPHFKRAFPGLGPHDGTPIESQKAFPAPINELEIVSRKIIRGMEYWLERRYVEKPLEVEAYVYIGEKTLHPHVQQLLNLGRHHTYGPGFELTRVSGPSGQAIIYKIKIWGTINVYGSVMTPDEH